MLRGAVLAAAIAAATLALGWWGVPLVGGAWGAMTRGARGAAAAAALGGTLGWGALLLWDVARDPAAAAPASSLGGAVGAPAGVVVAVTLLFAALLAWSATVLLGALTRPRASPR